MTRAGLLALLDGRAKALAQRVDTVQCMDALQFLRLLPDNYVDMALTSPPYDDLRTYSGVYSFEFEPIARETYRVLKPGGVLVWVVGDETIGGSETLSSFKQAIYFVEGAGFKLHDTMIFEKNASSPNIHHPRYGQSFEYMFVLLKGDKPRAWNPLMKINKLVGQSRSNGRTKMQRNGTQGVWGNGGSYGKMSVRQNVWTYNVGAASGDDKIAFDHPAPFPEDLARDHILSWTNPGDLVLDFFMGSGTTAKMARVTGRKFIGCDISAEYVELARKRVPHAYTLDMFEALARAEGA